MPDQWDQFPDAPTHMQPDDWSAFPDAPDHVRKASKDGAAKVARPTGEVHDGDTFRMEGGVKARLSGVDAFELDQQGLTRAGLVPIGRNARDYLKANISPDSTVTGTGDVTYGRPVVTLDSNGHDVGKDLIYNGDAVATPEYLRADPRLTPYMETERLARLNRRGAFAGQFQTPSAHRHGAPDPWADPEWIDKPQARSQAVFFDDPTPFQGLRDDISQGYLKIWTDPSSKPEDLINYANNNGFIIDADETRKSYAERAKRGADPKTLRYATPPKLLTNPGDGAAGAGVRGLADPINLLDEMGAVVDSVGLTPGRENLWDSDRRFGDILYNNLDQNRSILAYDDANHPYARFGGQLASGLVIPGASVEGVGLAAARAVLREGGTRFAAEQLAVRSRLGIAGAVEGGLAGFGQGEGGIVDRLPSAAVGAVTGGLLGYGTGALAQEAGPLARTALNRIRGRGVAETAVDQAPGIGVDETSGNMPPLPVRTSDAEPTTRDFGDGAARSSEWDQFPDAPEHIADMANESPMPSASISSPRTVDRIEVNNRARPLLDPATEMERRAAADRLNPSDVLPLPTNVITSQEEAARISSGLYPPVAGPNEAGVLDSRTLPVAGTSKELPKRGPADLMTFLRSKGGLIDQHGELSAMGVSNADRDLDFARGEKRFGKMVDNENGMRLDDAADLAWRAGYFPDHAERPTVGEFLDAIDNTNRGINRAFHPDDLPEVDAYNAARDQRYAVEKARDAGAPLAEDRGQPVTLDDLDANAPPVSAYEEWGEQAPDFAGNIRLSKLDSPQEIKRALVQTEQQTGGFDAARRGRISQVETQSLADELGMTPDDLLRRRKGQAMNAEEALAARQILAKSGNELVNMARAIQRLDDPGEEKLSAFRQAWVRHVAIQEQIAGATAEAGRTLAQFRMVADGRNVRGNVLNALSESGGGKDRLKEAAGLILEHVDKPGEMNKAAQKALKPKWLDKINELWINSLLSGPATHVVNAVSNTMTALAQIPEHAIAAGVGGVRSVAQRKRIDDRVLFSELGARTVGLLQGTKEGLMQAARTLRTGEGSDFGNKVEARTQDAISGLKGNVIRFPTRMLSSSDELFKAMARRMELNGLAVRQAHAEGLRGEAGIKRTAELVANPTDDMLEKAFDYGRYITFQRPLSPGMAGISRGIQNTAGLKFIIPFVRTPTNLLKFSLERSPAAIFMDTWKADFRAGGALRDLAVARAMVGTGVGALVADMASKGLITGNGPADKDAKQLMRADGWQPYSVKIGDKYYSYSRLDPFATTLGVAAGMVDLQQHMSEKQKGDVATLVTISIMQNLSNKTWLSGIGDLVRAIDDPDRYGSSWTERLAGSAAVPAGAAQLARTIDPTLRDADGILDSIRARIPGLSSSLPPRRDVWGQPIVGEGGAGPDLISPAYVSTRKGDPVNTALIDADVHVSKPQKKWRGRELTPKEYGDFHELSGSFGKQTVEGLIASPDWQTMTQDDRQEAVSKAMRDARKVAGSILFSDVRSPQPSASRVNPWDAFPDAPASAYPH